MALRAVLETAAGEVRPLYVRVNNAEASNHGVRCHALLRGYLSKEAFDARKAYVWERELAFYANVGEPLWPQAYAAAKSTPAAELPAEPEAVEGEPDSVHEAALEAWRIDCDAVRADNAILAALAQAEDC